MDNNIPNWSQYFMTIASVVSSRSKDSQTKVGCVIIDKDNHIIGTGFNGFPPGMLETKELWQRPIKYNFVIHAEAGCLLNCSDINKGHKLFCTLFPCKECSKLIAATGIKKVYYKDHELNGKDYLDPISIDIFKRCGIQVMQLK